MTIKDFTDKGFVKTINEYPTANKLLRLTANDYKITISVWEKKGKIALISIIEITGLKEVRSIEIHVLKSPELATKLIDTFLSEALNLDKIFE